MAYAHPLTDDGLLRLEQIIGSTRKGIAPILPISKTSFYRGIREGRYPAPVKLGERTSAWKVSEIRALLGKD